MLSCDASISRKCNLNNTGPKIGSTPETQRAPVTHCNVKGNPPPQKKTNNHPFQPSANISIQIPRRSCAAVRCGAVPRGQSFNFPRHPSTSWPCFYPSRGGKTAENFAEPFGSFVILSLSADVGDGQAEELEQGPACACVCVCVRDQSQDGRKAM